jgi:hypothetical protein
VTVAEIAKEMGIDAGSLDPKFVAKLDETFTASATQLSTAQQLKQQAEADLQKAQKDREEIDTYIAQFGADQTALAALQANNAAMAASLKTLKEQGFQVDIPEAPKLTPKNAPEAFDPNKFRADVGNVMVDVLNGVNAYQRLYGSACPDDMNVIAREAAQARMSPGQFMAQKYKFADKEKEKTEAARKAEIDTAVKAAVEKDRAERGNLQNPDLRPGRDSRHSVIMKPREAGDLRKFSNLTAREKISQSVARTRQAIASQNQ